MRLSCMTLLVGVMNASLPLCASEAIPLWGLGGPIGYATGGAGFGFTPVVANLEVTHLGYATGLREDGTFPLQFLNNPPAYFVGPNFQFAIVPEPSSLALGLMATLLLTTFGVRPWRRRGGHS